VERDILLAKRRILMSKRYNRMVIEVRALRPVGTLDPEDLSPDGGCAVDGLWLVSLTGRLGSQANLEGAALDVFHRVIPISNLEDYEIKARKPSLEDGPIREDLGLFSRLPDPPFTDRLMHEAFGRALFLARPDAPAEAIVFHVDTGEPDSPNTLIEAAVFDRGILDEVRMVGEPISLLVEKGWLTEALQRPAPADTGPEP
jgi:hypothetical protein